MVPIPRALAGRTSVSSRFPMWTVCSGVVPRPFEELAARLLVADDRGDAPDVDERREAVWSGRRPSRPPGWRRSRAGRGRAAAGTSRGVRVDRAFRVGPVGGQPAVQLVAVGLVAQQLRRQRPAETAGLRRPAAVVDAVEVGPVYARAALLGADLVEAATDGVGEVVVGGRSARRRRRRRPRSGRGGPRSPAPGEVGAPLGDVVAGEELLDVRVGERGQPPTV